MASSAMAGDAWGGEARAGQPIERCPIGGEAREGHCLGGEARAGRPIERRPIGGQAREGRPLERCPVQGDPVAIAPGLRGHRTPQYQATSGRHHGRVNRGEAGRGGGRGRPSCLRHHALLLWGGYP